MTTEQELFGEVEAVTGNTPRVDEDQLFAEPSRPEDNNLIRQEVHSPQTITNRIKQLHAERTSLTSPLRDLFGLANEESEARIRTIDDELVRLTTPPGQEKDFYYMVAEESMGLEAPDIDPVTIFSGVGVSQTILGLGKATVRGALLRGGLTATTATAGDIGVGATLEILEIESPWVRMAVDLGLGVLVGRFLEAPIEERVFREILLKDPEFFSKNLANIVSVNSKNVTKTIQKKLQDLATRADQGELIALKEARQLIRESIQQEMNPLKLVKNPVEDIPVPTRKELNREALRKNFSDIADDDLDDIQRLAHWQFREGTQLEELTPVQRINNAYSSLRKQEGTSFIDIARIRDQADVTQEEMASFIRGAIKGNKGITSKGEALYADPTSGITRKIAGETETHFLFKLDKWPDIVKPKKINGFKQFQTEFSNLRNRVITKLAGEAHRDHPLTSIIQTIGRQGGFNQEQLTRIAGTKVVSDLKKKFPNLIKKDGKVNPFHKAVDYDYGDIREMLLDFHTMPTFKNLKAMISNDMAYDWDMLYLDAYARHLGGTELQMWRKIGGDKIFNRIKRAATKDAATIAEPPKLLRHIFEDVNFIRRIGNHAVKATSRIAKAEARLKLLSRTQAIRNSLKLKREVHTAFQEMKTALRYHNMPYAYEVQLNNFLNPYLPKQSRFEPLQIPLREFLLQEARKGVPNAKLLADEFDEVLDLTSRVSDWKELSITQLRQLRALIKNFKRIGNRESVVDRISEKKAITEYVRPIKTTADDVFNRSKEDPTQRQFLTNPKARRDTTAASDTVPRLFSHLKRAEFILREIDGWEDFGPAQRMMNIAKLAEEQKFEIGSTLRQRWQDIMKDYATALGRKRLTPKFWQEVFTDSRVPDVKLTRETMLSMAAMTGNKHNKQALINSVGIGEVTIDRFLRENMTKEDWGLVRNIWKMTDEMYDLLNDVHIRMRGRPLTKVDNYFPIMPDWRFRTSPKDDSIEDVFFDLPQKSKIPRQLNKQFFMERTGGSDAIRVDFDAFAKHLRDVSHTVSHWEATQDLRKIIENRVFKDTVIANLGKPKYEVLQQWYKDLIRPEPVDAPFAKQLRANVTVAALGLKITTAIVQPASLISAIPRVGVVNVLESISTFIENPRAFKRMVDQLSPQMRMRDQVWQRDLSELFQTQAAERFKKMSQLDRNFFFSLIRMGDVIGAYNTWYAGWLKGIKKFDGDAKKALAYADQSVRLTQPQSGIKDLPRVMKSGKEWQRWLTMFYSYYSVLLNQTTEMFQRYRYGDASTLEVMTGLAFMYLVPGIATNIIREREVNPETIYKNTLTHIAGGIPVVRDITNATVMGYDYTISPAMDVGEQTVRAARTIGKTAMELTQGEYEPSIGDATPFIKLLGYGLGVPTGQALTMIRGMHAWYEGEPDIDPLDILLKRTESERE